LSVSNPNDVSRKAFRIGPCHLTVAVHIGLQCLIRSERDQPKRSLKHSDRPKRNGRPSLRGKSNCGWQKSDALRKSRQS